MPILTAERKIPRHHLALSDMSGGVSAYMVRHMGSLIADEIQRKGLLSVERRQDPASGDEILRAQVFVEHPDCARRSKGGAPITGMIPLSLIGYEPGAAEALKSVERWFNELESKLVEGASAQCLVRTIKTEIAARISAAK